MPISLSKICANLLSFLRAGFLSARNLFLLCLLLILAGSIASAESLSISGVPFKVDSISYPDAQSVKVDLAQESTLISRGDLNNWVVKWYFANPARTALVGAANLVNFVSNSLAVGNVDYAARGFLYLLQFEPAFLAAEYLEGLSRMAGAGDMFRIVLSQANWNTWKADDLRSRQDILSAMLFCVGLSDADWVRARALSLVYVLGDDFKDYLWRRFVQYASTESFDSLKAELVFCLDIFGAEDALYIKMRSLSTRLEDFKRIQQSEDGAQLFPFVDVCRQDEPCSQVIYPQLAERLRADAKAAIEAGNPNKALLFLAHEDLSRRTPQTHSLVTKALELMEPAENSALNSALVAEMLYFLAQNDEALRLQYLSCLERFVFYWLKNGQPAQSEVFFARILKLRPDVNPQNDRIRIEQALAYFDKRENRAANLVVSQVRSGISLVDRVKLGFAGLYIRRSSLLVIFILFLSSSLAFLGIQIVKILRKVRQARLSAVVDAAGRVVTDPVRSEYIKCLALLGLEEGVSAQEIKRAFRSAVKQTHPDRQKEHSGKATSDFMVMKEAYHRVLELRRRLSLPEE